MTGQRGQVLGGGGRRSGLCSGNREPVLLGGGAWAAEGPLGVVSIDGAQTIGVDGGA